MSHANQGLKGVKNHVVVTPFIEKGFATFSEPRSGGTVSPLRGFDLFFVEFYKSRVSSGPLRGSKKSITTTFNP